MRTERRRMGCAEQRAGAADARPPRTHPSLCSSCEQRPPLRRPSHGGGSAAEVVARNRPEAEAQVVHVALEARPALAGVLADAQLGRRDLRVRILLAEDAE